MSVRYTSDDMRDMLHFIMEDGEWWFAKDLGPALKREMLRRTVEDTGRHTTRIHWHNACYDWDNRSAQLLRHDPDIKTRMGKYTLERRGRYWGEVGTVNHAKQYRYLDENDYRYWTR